MQWSPRQRSVSGHSRVDQKQDQMLGLTLSA
jgi:hypothetical protein